jgi:hypothetical protein
MKTARTKIRRTPLIQETMRQIWTNLLLKSPLAKIPWKKTPASRNNSRRKKTLRRTPVKMFPTGKNISNSCTSSSYDYEDDINRYWEEMSQTKKDNDPDQAPNPEDPPFPRNYAHHADFPKHWPYLHFYHKSTSTRPAWTPDIPHFAKFPKHWLHLCFLQKAVLTTTTDLAPASSDRAQRNLFNPMHHQWLDLLQLSICTTIFCELSTQTDL